MFLELFVFLLKAIIVVGGVVSIFMVLASLKHKAKQMSEQGYLSVVDLEEQSSQLIENLQTATLSKKEQKKLKKAQKTTEKQKEIHKPHLFILNFNGDIKASSVFEFAKEIDAILNVAKKNDEVLIRLESAGGLVHAYGLAAAQIVRLKRHAIKVTVAVDKVAASGGYMMACVADHIVAAPFAIIGSIGVVGQLPNFNRLLKKNSIDFEMHTAGDYKRTLTVFGENTDKGREKFKDDIQLTHQLFKEFIHEHRPNLELANTATGEIWYGNQARALNLIDEVTISDEWIFQHKNDFKMIKLQFVKKSSFKDRLGQITANVVDKGIDQLDQYVIHKEHFK